MKFSFGCVGVTWKKKIQILKSSLHSYCCMFIVVARKEKKLLTLLFERCQYFIQHTNA